MAMQSIEVTCGDCGKNKSFIVNDVKPLHLAKKNYISFFDSSKYISFASNTDCGVCITTEDLQKHLPNKTQKVIVKNVLFELAKVLTKLYLNADVDYPDLSLKKPNKNKHKFVKFGNNVLIGNKVKIGKNSLVITLVAVLSTFVISTPTPTALSPFSP